MSLRPYLYLNCTRVGQFQRQERQERHEESVSCVLSIRVRSSNPTRASKNLSHLSERGHFVAPGGTRGFGLRHLLR